MLVISPPATKFVKYTLAVVATRDVTIWVDAILRIAFECTAIYCRMQYVVRLIKEHIMSLKLA